MSTKNETKNETAKNEVPALETIVQDLKDCMACYDDASFYVSNVKYIGRVYTNPDEYIKLLATQHSVEEATVLPLIIEAYQRLQMTRVAQGMAKTEVGLKEGDIVDVTKLPGTRTSKWGDLAKYIDEAKDVLKRALASGALDEETAKSDEQIRKTAGKIKALRESVNVNELV